MSPTYIAGVIVALVFAIVIFFVLQKPVQPLWDTSVSEGESRQVYEYAPNPNSTLIKFTEGVNVWYVNETLRFSFRIPDDFSAPDGKVKDSNTHVVELSNGKGNMLQIVAMKIKDDASETLTEEILRQQLPEESLSNFKSTSLKEGTSGLYFETSSAAVGGNGIAFWFTKNSYLYTLTTTKKDTELLELVMQTWHFGGAIAPPAP